MRALMNMILISAETVRGCSSHRAGGWSFHLLSVLLLWSEQMHGLSDFSTYLFRIIISHSAHARDGELLLLSCPRHSTISVQSAFYRPHAPLAQCNAPTALQKVLSECQGRRNCQVLVNYRLFGSDPCPGTTKHLHVSYSCKPMENKNKTICEGDKMLLHCKYPKLLNIYSAVYGRELGGKPICPPAEEEHPPPFECLYYGALDMVKKLCYGKQRCHFIVNDQQFRNPCTPEAKKYLRVLYSCVPKSLLQEADPNFFQTTTAAQESTKAGKVPDVRESRLPVKNGILVSNSLMAYGYITEHPEKAGLLFVSSVCLGLFFVMLAISIRITCSRNLKGVSHLNKKADTVELKDKDDDDNDEDSDGEESDPLMDSSMMSEVGRKVYCWEEAMYTTEAAEMIERLERREMIIQEIRMNAYLNGTSCTLR